MSGFLANITPVIIVKNGEEHVTSTLSSLKGFSNVIVYDNGSTDSTVELADGFDNVSLVKGQFYGFGPTKNAAARYADTEWVLSLDIDERPDAELIKALDNWSPGSRDSVGEVLRENYFCGKAINTNGWGGDVLVRLYNKEVFSFDDSMVHEKILLDGSQDTIRLKGKLKHAAITDASQLLDKAQLYSEIFSRSPKAKLYSFFTIFMKTLFAFFRSYVLRAGFLSGWRGFSIAFGESVGVYFKYLKVFQRTKGQGREE